MLERRVIHGHIAPRTTLKPPQLVVTGVVTTDSCRTENSKNIIYHISLISASTQVAASFPSRTPPKPKRRTRLGRRGTERAAKGETTQSTRHQTTTPDARCARAARTDETRKRTTNGGENLIDVTRIRMPNRRRSSDPSTSLTSHSPDTLRGGLSPSRVNLTNDTV